MFRIRQANKEYQCILCGKNIPAGEKYIRPYHLGLDKIVSKGVTWRQKRPYLHVECFKVLKRWFKSTVPVYDNEYQQVHL